jgi:hypothetical protein
MRAVDRWHRLLETARRSPANIRFSDLRGLVERAGFVLRSTRGSHRIYRHATRREIPLINLQEERGGKAKPYQVRQVVRIIDEWELEVKP